MYYGPSVADCEAEIAELEKWLQDPACDNPEDTRTEISGLGEMSESARLAGCIRRDLDTGICYDRFDQPNPRCR